MNPARNVDAFASFSIRSFLKIWISLLVLLAIVSGALVFIGHPTLIQDWPHTTQAQVRFLESVLAVDFILVFLLPIVSFIYVQQRKNSTNFEKYIADGQLRYQELINNIQDNIMVLDKAGFITYTNDASEITGGYKREDIIGKHISQAGFFKASDIPKYMQIVSSVLSGKTIEGVEMDFFSATGEPRVAQVTASAIRLGGKIVGLQAFWRDVTKQKQYEQKISDLNQVLKILNKIMRHDLLNDLTVMQGNIDLYLEYKDQDVEELLKQVNAAVERGKSLIAQMKDLELSVTTGEKLIAIKAREIIEKVSSEFQELTVTITGDVQILADTAFSSIVVNFFRNAIRHGQATQMNVTLSTKGKMATISFADNGNGVPDDVKPQLFQEGAKFGKTGNTGLGLYIIRKTIERYGGTVTVGDAKPKGAVFTLTVPVAE